MSEKSLLNASHCCFLLSVACVLASFLNVADASNGDRSYIFEKCIRGCYEANCSRNVNFAASQPLHMQLLKWTCDDECKYQCMWSTVDAFHRDGSKTPQFYGKWPFIRYAGVQEPAAAIFSILNGLSHLSIFVFRQKVPSSTPMYKIWHVMAVIGGITWLCATMFHIRDTPFTEKLDYFSAFGLVLFNLFTLICRVVGTHQSLLLAFVATVLTALYTYHIHYLTFVKFDYGYNMILNIAVGAVNAVGWIVWCFYHARSKPYWWKCATVMFGLNILLLLELGDFPPILWTFDAHAIWHAGTAPLSLLWYSFIIDDSLHDLKLVRLPDYKKML